MSSIPTKEIVGLYEKSVVTPCNQWIRSKNGKYEMYIEAKDQCAKRILLEHHGTRILSVDMDDLNVAIGGYSSSDRDAINSILIILHSNKRAYIKNAKLMLREVE